MKFPFMYYHRKRESMKQKKEYVEPEMKVVEMECQAALLEESSDVEFGLASTSNDHLA